MKSINLSEFCANRRSQEVCIFFLWYGGPKRARKHTHTFQQIFTSHFHKYVRWTTQRIVMFIIIEISRAYLLAGYIAMQNPSLMLPLFFILHFRIRNALENLVLTMELREGAQNELEKDENVKI